MLDRIQAGWDRLQDFLDISGDVWLGLFTAAIVARVVLVLRGHGPINMAEATAYGSAVGAFAYSKHGGPKQS